MSILNDKINKSHLEMADELEKEGHCNQPKQRVSLQKPKVQEQWESPGNFIAEEEICCETEPVSMPIVSTKDKIEVNIEAENPGFERIPVSSVVVVFGLKSEAGKTLNGCRGVVLAYIPEAERYLLKMEGEKILKRIRAINLRSTGLFRTIEYEYVIETAKRLKRPLKWVLKKGVDIREFTFGGNIGNGRNSNIYVATKEPGYDMGEDESITKVAFKAISKDLLRTSDKAPLVRRSLMCERKTMYKCRGINPFILDLYATSKGEDDIFFVIEYAPRFDLQRWALKFRGMPESCVRFYIACLVDALESMHEIKVYHRDVKPENVFLDEQYLPKLGDFGCAIEHGDVIDFIGTPSYMPPEMIRRQVQEDTVRATDYWSVGATLYFLEFGKLCFYGTSDYLILKKSSECSYEMPEHGDETTKDLIRSLLVVDINKRLGWNGGWQEIKSHKFFDGVDWETLRISRGPPINFWESNEGAEGKEEMGW